MLIAKRLGWILVGVVMGIGSAMAPRVVAQESASDRVVERVKAALAEPQVLTDHPASGFTDWKFVSDSRTHSCWLAALASNRHDVAALAPAPPEACR